MKRLLLLSISFFLFQCSTQRSLHQDSEAVSAMPPSVVVESTSSTISIVSSGGAEFSRPADTRDVVSGIPDTVRRNTSVVSDTLDRQQSYISAKLEEARLRYLAALSAQVAGDSTNCAAEFEGAIAALDELGYLPDIESNRDFMELSQVVLQDYEKYIVSIDDVGPGASVFALREKLSQIIEKVNPDAVTFPHEEIKGTSVPLPLNEAVERNIAFFMGERGRPHLQRWLELSGRYFPMMRSIFRQENVPEELLYLSMVESGLRPEARSWASAVGLWQFMRGTGHLYGLRGNWWYDERRDFEKSTLAAARHLKDLYAEFGDWHVVLAAYNAGAGRIYRAIRRSGSTDYWGMRPHLPRQTRNYVPQFIAVVRMALDPEAYGFHGIEPADSLAFEVVTLDDCVDLRVLARCAGTDIETLKSLNPELLQWCTPPGVTGYRLRIPVGSSTRFAEQYANVPNEQKRDWAVHTVRQGETLSTIARRYGLTAELLVNVNHVKNVKKLTVGSQLSIPLPKEMVASKRKVPFEYEPKVKGMDFDQVKAYVTRTATNGPSSGTARKPVAAAGKEQLVYRVKRGDTIGHVAEWFGVRASDIRNWNDIPYGTVLSINQELSIWVEPSRAASLRGINELSFAEKQSMRRERPVEASLFGNLGGTSRPRPTKGWIPYTVKRGDTLEKIAKQHGVGVVDLKAWNGLRTNEIRVGQELDIYSEPEHRSGIVESNSSTITHPQALPPETLTLIPQTSEHVVHHVKKGETLWQIARMYGVRVNEIVKHNRLGDVLKAGDRLTIPRQ